MKAARIVTVVVLCLAAVAAVADKEKVLRTPELPFWPGKGQPWTARQYVPGLNAALMLTPEQIEKLNAAFESTMRSAVVQAAGRTLKADPNATEAQKQAAREAVESARMQLNQSMAAILTAEQKALMERVVLTWELAVKGIHEEYQAQLVAAKGNDAEMQRLRNEIHQKLQADFVKKLELVLTPEQRAAMEKAAAEEKRAAEEGAKKKKG